VQPAHLSHHYTTVHIIYRNRTTKTFHDPNKLEMQVMREQLDRGDILEIHLYAPGHRPR
jgi:hypothetical protein